MRFKIGGKIEYWLRQNALFVQEQRDKQSAYAAIAIHEWMQNFELCVNYRKLHQGIRRFSAIVFQPVINKLREEMCFWRYMKGFFDWTSVNSYPILLYTNASWLFVLAAPTLEQYRMQFEQ